MPCGAKTLSFGDFASRVCNPCRRTDSDKSPTLQVESPMPGDFDFDSLGRRSAVARIFLWALPALRVSLVLHARLSDKSRSPGPLAGQTQWFQPRGGCFAANDVFHPFFVVKLLLTFCSNHFGCAFFSRREPIRFVNCRRTVSGWLSGRGLRLRVSG